MKHSSLRNLSIFLAIGFSAAFSWAWVIDPVNAIKRKGFTLAIGSEVVLYKSEASLRGSKAIYLGQVRSPNLRKQAEMVYVFRSNSIKILDAHDVSFTRYVRPEKILQGYEQFGNSCTAYAVYHHFTQMLLSGEQGQGDLLRSKLATEQGRAHLLMGAVNYYYVDAKYNTALAMKKLGVDLGLKCRPHRLTTPRTLRKFFLEKLGSSEPVVLSFNIGRDMVTSPFPIYSGHELQTEDDRLWVPRKKGQRLSSGHAVVLSSLVYIKQKPYAVVIDSNWTNPRLWDLEDYLFHPKVDIKDFEITSCKEQAT